MFKWIFAAFDWKQCLNESGKHSTFYWAYIGKLAGVPGHLKDRQQNHIPLGATFLVEYRIFPNKSPRPNCNPVLIEARASIRKNTLYLFISTLLLFFSFVKCKKVLKKKIEARASIWKNTVYAAAWLKFDLFLAGAATIELKF